jgi:hypothetical protein
VVYGVSEHKVSVFFFILIPRIRHSPVPALFMTLSSKVMVLQGTLDNGGELHENAYS